WDPRWLINGMLAGLVSITACCNVVNSAAAIVIGGVGGIVMHFGDQLLVRLKLDDAVGAIPVHGFAGVWGTLSVAIFGDPVLLGTDAPMLVRIGTQLFGILTCFAWTFGAALAFFWILNRWSPMRVSAEAEKIGLNIAEHRATTATLDLYQEMDHQARTGDLSLRASVEPFTEVGQIAERYNLVLERVRKTLAEKDDALYRLEKAHAEIQRDLEMARTIQRQLIPLRPPELEGAQLVSEYIALEQVGGDFIDYLTDEEGNIGVLIADASGHGVPAALLAAMAKMAIDGIRDRMHQPDRLLLGLNEALYGKTRDHFVTACYCVFESATRRIRYSIGGHPPPFLLRPGHSVRQLEGRGSLLGIVPQPRLGEWQFDLEPGDRLLFLTDGILECRAPDGTNMDESRLKVILAELSEHPAADLTSGFMKKLAEFMGAGSFEDDVSFVALYAT
ncbi:MAG: SpoIIE family protein phosphatase, partial [Leptospiraceae bacterium]|nr:SpoIIE family protein phosphatase [Leptospiraceae bacterium]